MNAWPRQDQVSMRAFYGDPDSNADGLPDADFESKYLTFIAPPYPMVFSWNMQSVGRIKINKRCADAALAALTQIGRDFSLAERDKYHLNRFGGAYCFRLMRGLSTLSIHAYGAALDIAPELNPLGVEYGSKPNMLPMKAVKIFEATGATWGGSWHRPDCQHFQWANI